MALVPPSVQGAQGNAASPAVAVSSRSAANKAFNEKKKAQRKELMAYLEAQATLPANIAAILSEWKAGTTRVIAGGTSLFNKVFGDSPAVGQSITLMQFFDKTNYGIKDMAHAIKKWQKEKGVVVEFKENPTSFKDSTYTIKSLG